MVSLEVLIEPAASPEDVEEARVLFREYAQSLPFELDFQHFEDELASLPGVYAPPGGTILLARTGGSAAGCVALRPQEPPDYCEMKRLYVRPDFRGLGLGRRLAEAVLTEARRLDYRAMRLDTVSWMREANALYDSLGFRPTDPYCYNPLADAAYYELHFEEE